MARKQWTERRRNLFLDTLRNSANVSAAARIAGMSRSAAYALRRQSTPFREDWDQALEEALDDLEEALRERAMTGVEKPIFYGGRPCGSITSYSDQLGIFLLKRRRPHIFIDDGVQAAEEAADREVAGAKEELARLLERVSGRGGRD